MKTKRKNDTLTGLPNSPGTAKRNPEHYHVSKPASKGAEAYEDPFGDDEDAGGAEEARGAAEEDLDSKEMKPVTPKVFLRGKDRAEEGERLAYDNSAYSMLHQLRLELPSLSFDFIRDNAGMNRMRFPHSAFIVLGSQAPGLASSNKLTVLKASDMYRTKRDRGDNEMSDSDESSDEEDNLDDDPIVDHRSVKHTGAVNRIRAMPQRPNIVASWSDTGRVYLWDLKQQLDSLGFSGQPGSVGNGAAVASATTPIFAFRGHKDEGFAMDWSPAQAGRLATGDCHRNIFVYQLNESGACTVDESPFKGHTDSVEDIQWSPTEGSVFASGSVDRTVKIWDTRSKTKAMLSFQAHETDVNVISWNRKVAYLLASGADDGSFKVWDMRMVKPGKDTHPVGHFTWHKEPITSIEWNPNDESVLAVSGDDNQVSVWDLALEEDMEHAASHPKLQSEAIGSDGQKINLPPQLLFLHEGQNQPKELHFHPQIPGLVGSTAADGFHFFICEPLDPRPHKLAVSK